MKICLVHHKSARQASVATSTARCPRQRLQNLMLSERARLPAGHSVSHEDRMQAAALQMAVCRTCCTSQRFAAWSAFGDRPCFFMFHAVCHTLHFAQSQSFRRIQRFVCRCCGDFTSTDQPIHLALLLRRGQSCCTCGTRRAWDCLCCTSYHPEASAGGARVADISGFVQQQARQGASSIGRRSSLCSCIHSRSVSDGTNLQWMYIWCRQNLLFVAPVWPERSSSAAGVRTSDLIASFRSQWNVHFLRCVTGVCLTNSIAAQ